MDRSLVIVIHHVCVCCISPNLSSPNSDILVLRCCNLQHNRRMDIFWRFIFLHGLFPHHRIRKILHQLSWFRAISWSPPMLVERFISYTHYSQFRSWQFWYPSCRIHSSRNSRRRLKDLEREAAKMHDIAISSKRDGDGNAVSEDYFIGGPSQ